jgi:hypothetical protein
LFLIINGRVFVLWVIAKREGCAKGSICYLAIFLRLRSVFIIRSDFVVLFLKKILKR